MIIRTHLAIGTLPYSFRPIPRSPSPSKSPRSHAQQPQQLHTQSQSQGQIPEITFFFFSALAYQYQQRTEKYKKIKTHIHPIPSPNLSLNLILLLTGSNSSHSLNFPVRILPLVPLMNLNLLPRTLHNLADAEERFPPGGESLANLDPLVKSKYSVAAPVDEESLIQLAEFSLNEAGANDIDDPHLNVLGWDSEGFGDSLVWEGACWCAGWQGSESEEADLAEKDVVWQSYFQLILASIIMYNRLSNGGSNHCPRPSRRAHR